nr:hypothetical protein [Corynebacterium lactis]
MFAPIARMSRTKASRAIAVATCAIALGGLAACSTPGTTAAGGASSSEKRTERAGVTTVARAPHINAQGHVSADLPPTNPKVLLPDPKPEQGKDYKRILTLDRAGALGRMVYSLGLGDRLVGRDLASDFPAVKDLPNLTPGGHSINAEAVMKLRPDIVLTDGTIGPSLSSTRWRSPGSPWCAWAPSARPKPLIRLSTTSPAPSVSAAKRGP